MPGKTTALVLQGAAEVVEWASEHPEQIERAGSWLKGLITTTPPFLVTGIKSAGKSVLWDFLTGAAYAEGYQPPDASASVDRGKLKGRGRDGSVPGVVVPGDPHSRARQDALEAHLGPSKGGVSGVVHVVCDGLARPRSSDLAAHLEGRAPRLEDYVAGKRREELEDYDRICHELEGYWRRHHRPFWLLIVCAKADLYQGRLSEVAERYCPGGSGAFAQRIDRLRGDIGRLNVNVDVAAVSCLAEDFRWAEETISSRLDERARRAYVANLRTKIFALTGAREG
ncbi:MAG: hypothetical protein KC457_33000 [Myxococcales bacterium]|nr:hypothetical protein [Myxococcales bacterium]